MQKAGPATEAAARRFSTFVVGDCKCNTYMAITATGYGCRAPEHPPSQGRASQQRLEGGEGPGIIAAARKDGC